MRDEDLKEQVLRRITSSQLRESSSQLRENIHTDTTPVPHFGDIINSELFTLGLNPSSREFPKDKKERRLVHLSDLDLSSEYYRNGETHMPRELAEQVYAGLNRYFENRPYGWFLPVEECLQIGFSASYFHGKGRLRACHIDVFPWTTDAYSRLSGSLQKEFRDENCSFLMSLLKSLGPKYLVILGQSTMNALQKQMPLVYRVIKQESGIHESRFEVGATRFGDEETICFRTSKGPSAQFHGKEERKYRMEIHEAFGRFIKQELS